METDVEVESHDLTRWSSAFGICSDVLFETPPLNRTRICCSDTSRCRLCSPCFPEGKCSRVFGVPLPSNSTPLECVSRLGRVSTQFSVTPLLNFKKTWNRCPSLISVRRSLSPASQEPERYVTISSVKYFPDDSKPSISLHNKGIHCYWSTSHSSRSHDHHATNPVLQALFYVRFLLVTIPLRNPRHAIGVFSNNTPRTKGCKSWLPHNGW